MAWSVDQTTIGSAYVTVSSTTAAFTTTQNVAPGAWIFLSSGSWATAGTGGALTSVSGGGLTWEVVGSNTFTGNGDLVVGLARAYAPNGLPSGTTLTATHAAAMQFKIVGAASFLGGGPASVLENTVSTNGTSLNAWTAGTGPNSASSSALIVGAAHNGNPNTDTPDSNTTEAWLLVGSTAVSGTMVYRLASASGNNPVGGTWVGAADTWSGIAGSFSLGNAAFVPHRMPLGV